MLKISNLDWSCQVQRAAKKQSQDQIIAEKVNMLLPKLRIHVIRDEKKNLSQIQ